MIYFIIIWLIVYFVWWVIDRIAINKAFKELNEEIDFINNDLKRFSKNNQPQQKRL